MTTLSRRAFVGTALASWPLVHAFGQGLPRQSHTMVNFWCEDPLTGPAWTCARQLYRRSDFREKERESSPAFRNDQSDRAKRYCTVIPKM